MPKARSRAAVCELTRPRYRAEIVAEAEAILNGCRAQVDHARTMHLRGLMAMSDGADALAVDCLRRAVQLELTNADYLADLGTSLSIGDRAVEAIGAFCRALQLKPDNSELCRQFGDAFVQLDRPREALAMYFEYMRLDPSSTLADVTVGVLLEKT